MIVRDTHGEKLRLTNVRLTELVGANRPEQPWYALLADIASAADKGCSAITVRLHEKFVVTDAHRGDANAYGPTGSFGTAGSFDYDAWVSNKKRHGVYILFGYDNYCLYRIGCRRFDKKTFDFIVAVARASVARYR